MDSAMRTAAAELVGILNDEGVAHVFVNPGMLTSPLRAALVEAEASGARHSYPVLCPHEHVAICAAHGHHLAGGGPQAVMLRHQRPLNVSAALADAERGRVPITLFSGVAPAEPGVTMLEGASRPRWPSSTGEGGPWGVLPKWVADLSSGGSLGHVARRAFQMSRTEPLGTTQLILPPECLRQRATGPTRRLAPPRPPAPDPAVLDEMADLLATAERPLIATGRTGRHISSVRGLAMLAETLGAPVLDLRNYVNLPPRHPLNAGLDAGSLMAEADAILLLDVDLSSLVLAPPPQAWLLQVDTDCLRASLPDWACPMEIAVNADTRLALPQLQAALAHRLTPRRRQIQGRRAHAEAELGALRASWRQRAEAGEEEAAADALLAELDRVLPEDSLVLDEASGNAVLRQVERPPGHFFRCTPSTAGWALGAALGARLARPNQPVVALCDERAFADGLPSAAFWAAHRDGAAFLAVVLDHDPSQRPRSTTRSRLPSDVVELARAAGAEAEVVTHPSQTAAAVERLLATTRDGVCAVLDARLP
jgi:acetolactate synthase-1/2/3 large subunit